MKKLVFIAWTLLIKEVFCENDKITFFDNSEGTQIGQLCSLGVKNGTCELISNCRAHFKNSPILRICGNENKIQIICCPKDAKMDRIKMFNKLPQFNEKCTAAKTNETGNLKLISHCPRIESEVQAGSPFPRVCEYELCKDMVCCPIEHDKHINGKLINISFNVKIILINFSLQ